MHEPTPPEITQTLDRFPTPLEIRSRVGWPTPEYENQLRQVFLKQMTPQAQRFLERHTPKLHPTPHQLNYFTHVLYGIYLFNYITGGKLIHEQCYPTLSKSAGHLRLNPNLLTDWPIWVGPIEGGTGANVQPTTGIIRINSDCLINYSPHSLLKPSTHATFRIPKDAPSFTTSELGIIIGIEEAHHAFVTRSGYASSFNPFVLPPRFKVDAELTHYESNTSIEFQASSMKANIVERYFSDLWNSRGYKQFWTNVSNRRRHLFK